MAVPVKVARQQTTPKPSETLQLSAGTNRNPPEPSELASGTYTSTHRNPLEPSGTCLRNLHHHTPELSRTFRNLPPEPTPAHTRTPSLRNLHQHTPEPCSNYISTPEPSGTCLRNLHQHTPEPSGTFRNLPPKPTPAHTGTLRNLPEPSSGTCSCDPHRHTPELIWAEDPISLRCWGIKSVIDLWKPPRTVKAEVTERLDQRHLTRKIYCMWLPRQLYMKECPNSSRRHAKLFG